MNLEELRAGARDLAPALLPQALNCLEAIDTLHAFSEKCLSEVTQHSSQSLPFVSTWLARRAQAESLLDAIEDRFEELSESEGFAPQPEELWLGALETALRFDGTPSLAEARHCAHDVALNVGRLSAKLEEGRIPRVPFQKWQVLILADLLAQTPSGLDTTARAAGVSEGQWYWRIGAGVEATTWESASELNRQARLAERQDWTQNTYGVSATTKETPSSAKALRSLVEEHFRVLDTPTIMNPHHKTIELPKPVTEEAADTFNRLWGRTRRPSGG